MLSHAATSEQLRNSELLWTGGHWGGQDQSGALGCHPAALSAFWGTSNERFHGSPRSAKLGEVDAETEPMPLRISSVALAAVALGDLNAVAEVVAMFFLTTYGMLNLAGLEESSTTHYRPRVLVGVILGAAGRFVAMFAINPRHFFGGRVIGSESGGTAAPYSPRSMGDLRTGLWFAMARMAMLQLRGTTRPRNWRPHILVFSLDLSRNIDLVALASHFGQDRHVTATTLLKASSVDTEHAFELRKRNVRLLEDAGLLAFTEVVAVPDLEAGFMTVAQANGFGGIDSNMVVFGWPGDDPDRLADMLVRSRQLASLHKSTMFVRGVRSTPPASLTEPEIIVWWKGRAQNGDPAPACPPAQSFGRLAACSHHVGQHIG